MPIYHDVTVTLRSGHQIQVPEWEDYNGDAFAEVLRGFAGELIWLGTDPATKPLVRVDEIAAVTAEPSTGIRAVQHGDDGLYVWGCLRCGELGEDPSENAGLVAFTGAMTHRCGANRG